MSELIHEVKGFHVFSFNGGGRRGKCLSFETTNGPTELTHEEVLELYNDLRHWLQGTTELMKEKP